MEILGIIGIIVLIVFFFVAGGLLGWIVKGLGVVIDLLFKGWGSCISCHLLDLRDLHYPDGIGNVTLLAKFVK